MRYHAFLAIALLAIILVACGDDAQQVKQEADAVKAQLQEASAKLAETRAQADDALKQLQSQGEELNSCLQKVGKQDNQTKALIKSLGDELATAHSDLEECQKGQDAVIEDAARRLCCMKRIDDPTIDSYSIVKDKIVCEKGGDRKISC